MTLIPFGKWKPDQLSFNDPSIAGEAKGVLWGGNGYIPWPQMSAITSAFAAAARGAYLARKTDGTLQLYVGTSSKLYRLDSSTTITEVTRLVGGDYTVPADDQWSFAQFGIYLIAVNGTDAPQVIDVDAGTNFAALAGSPPTSAGVRTIGNQVFLFRQTSNPNRVTWSGRGDHTYWTVGMKDCDRQDFQDGGQVNGMTKLETGLLFQEGAIRRMTPVTSRAVYRFDRVEEARGLIAPGSLVTLGNTAFYLSEEGFFATDGAGQSARIGVNEIDDWFKDNCNQDRLYSIVGCVDPATHHIFWLFPSTGTTSAVLDHMLCYDIMQKAWTHAEVSASYIFSAATLGYTVDTLDALLTALGLTMDTATFSVDARWLRGGAPTLAAIDSNHKLAFIAGTPMAFTLETGDFEPVIGRRSFVNGITPVTDHASVQVQLGTKETISGALSYNSAQTVNARGTVSPLKAGRVCRVRVTGAAGDTWNHMQAVDVRAVDDGEI